MATAVATAMIASCSATYRNVTYIVTHCTIYVVGRCFVCSSVPLLFILVFVFSSFLVMSLFFIFLMFLCLTPILTKTHTHILQMVRGTALQ